MNHDASCISRPLFSVWKFNEQEENGIIETQNYISSKMRQTFWGSK